MPKKKTKAVKPKTASEQLAEVVKQKGSERAVAEELRAVGVKCSQQSINAWIKRHWPPRPATQQALKKLYRIPAVWGEA